MNSAFILSLLELILSPLSLSCELRLYPKDCAVN